MKRQNKVKEWIVSTMEEVGMDIELKLRRTNVNMSYNFIYHYIGLDVVRAIMSNEEMDIPVPLETYIKTLTLHELGHAVDREALLDSLQRTIEIAKMKKKRPSHELFTDVEALSMLIEEHEMNIAFEETAWANAETLNRLHQVVDLDHFEQVKAHNLATYRNLYEEDLRIYDELLAKGQIA